MCQLTFFDTNDKTLSTNLVQLVGIANTLKGHNDGYGIFSNSKVYKTKETPVLDDLFFQQIEKYCGRTGIFHVRKASVQNKDKEIRDKDAHPFQETVGKNVLTLAHNGTLNLYSNAVQEFKDLEKQDIIDSQVFLKALALNMNKNKYEIVEGLQSTMKAFYGKYAFMINYKKNFYIVRGNRATLFKVKVTLSNNKKIFLVNTEKDSIVLTLNFLRKVLTNIYDSSIHIKEESDITLLSNETIFIYNPTGMEVEKVGEIKENYASTTTTKKKDKTYFQRYLNRRKEPSKQLPAPKAKDSKTETEDESFLTLVRGTNLKITELSHLFSTLYGISILAANEYYIEDFEQRVTELINLEAFNKRQKTYKDLLGKITSSGKYLGRYEIASNESLEPLYFINTPRELQRLLKI